jgi:hypothetical protein
MPAWSVILLIVVASFILGWLIWQRFNAAVPRLIGSYLEAAFAALALGVAVLGWLAFVLAEVGWFSVERLGLIWLLLVVGLATSNRLTGDRRRVTENERWQQSTLRQPQGRPVKGQRSRSVLPIPDWVELPLLGIWFVTAAWLFFRPHEFVGGAADAGVYVNLGAEIARHGGILIQDDTLAALDPALYPALLRPLPNDAIAPYYVLPAFFVTGEPAGEITPQFYHLHPVWQAIAYDLGGVWPELMLTGLWALLGSLAVYFTVRQFAGWQVAALALAGLSLNALQVWFARYPTAETLTQYLFWTGLWSLGAWLSEPALRLPKGRSPLWPLLAGVTLGQVFLVRIDAYFLLAVLGLIGLWRYGAGRWHKTDWWFWLPLALLTVHSFVHALWQSRPYFYSIFAYGVQLLRVNWAIPLLVVVPSAGLLLAISRYRQQLGRLAGYRRPVLMAGIVATLALAGYGWFVRPYVDLPVSVWNEWYSGQAIGNFDRENLLRFAWYLAPAGVWLGIAGGCLLLWRLNRQTVAIVGMGLLFSSLYLWRIQANPHHIYAMRRYVPVVMPFFVVAAAYWLGWLAAQQKRWLSAAALLLAILWLGGLSWSARGFVSQVDYRGMIAQLDAIDAPLTAGAVLLFNDQAPIGQGDVWGTPLRFLYGHDVFSLRDPAFLDTAHLNTAIRQWQAAGRTVYWVETAGGADWQPAGQMKLAQSYQLEAIVMENTYDHRPSRLVSWTWTGEIYELPVLPPAP